MPIYNPEYAVAAIVHVIFGVSWVGMHVANEVLLIPEMRRAQALKEMPVFRSSLKKISTVAAIVGFGTLFSGLAYLFVKFGVDPAQLTADPQSRTVLVGLGIVLALLSIGMGVLRPFAMALGKQAAQMDPAAPFPEAFRKGLDRLVFFLHINSAGVLLTLVLMVLATQGGI